MYDINEEQVVVPSLLPRLHAGLRSPEGFCIYFRNVKFIQQKTSMHTTRKLRNSHHFFLVVDPKIGG